MTKRKKIKRRNKRAFLKFDSNKRRKKKKTAQNRVSLTFILVALAVVCVLAAIGIGFIFLDKYVAEAVPVSQAMAALELVEVPSWVNQTLKDKIYSAASADEEDLKLDEDVAQSVQQNIESMVAWVDGVKVQTTHDSLRITAQWRRPVALIKSGLHKFYVDPELVVLDFVPIPNLPIVEVKGLSVRTPRPPLGQVWYHDDLAAAVEILTRMSRMDELVTADKPLLYEIESINVSNFNGRENSSASHIILYTKDNTEIIWGAEVGTWQRYLEASDEEKLAKLYGYYEEYGSLLDGVKYINLRDPQVTVPQPVDKY